MIEINICFIPEYLFIPEIPKNVQNITSLAYQTSFTQAIQQAFHIVSTTFTVTFSTLRLASTRRGNLSDGDLW